MCVLKTCIDSCYYPCKDSCNKDSCTPKKVMEQFHYIPKFPYAVPLSLNFLSTHNPWPLIMKCIKNMDGEAHPTDNEDNQRL